MRVTLDEVAQRLAAIGGAESNTQLPRVILLNGNEPLLVEEALDRVRRVLKDQGFSERLRLVLIGVS